MRKCTIILMSFSLITSLLKAEEKVQQKIRTHKAHSHGSGNLSFVTSDNALVIELNVPAHDVVGFEHAPKNDSQKSLVKQAIEFLEQSNSNISLPETAKCKPQDIGKVETELDVSSSSHDTHEHHQNNHEHAEFHVKYQFTCKNLEKLSFIKVLSFQKFNNIKKLKAQGVTKTGQFAKTLTAKSPQFDLSK
ncbi:MAG TPA: DUF2796 domain-containing protein [Oligoflexia bacterium]|nr:DUF2796 domain-containing protein [Oligoflexia bacterium]HMR24658.1 DUF2796 domain-containing protein [Oligoflexia bacterium]